LFLLGTNLLDPIVNGLTVLLTYITGITHNFGWSLIILAGLIKLTLWPLTTKQYSSMIKNQAVMKELQPKLNALKAKHKDDPQTLNTETMALYKEVGFNPASGCLPALLPMPVLFSVWYAINAQKSLFASTDWGWVGSGLSHAYPAFLATSLAQPDHLLLLLYAASMYVSIKISSPALDPQQAQTQRIMSIISPLMIAWFGLQYKWPSAFLLYWLSFNLFQMGQQLYLVRRFKPELAAAAAAAGKTAPPAGGAGTKPPVLTKPAPQKDVAKKVEPPVESRSGATPAANGAPGSKKKKKARP
jgi:YidC/Oxa1 family membrane protein insertase